MSVVDSLSGVGASLVGAVRGDAPFAPAFAMVLGRRQPGIAQAKASGYLGGYSPIRLLEGGVGVCLPKPFGYSELPKPVGSGRRKYLD